MLYKTLAGTDISVCAAGLGTWVFGGAHWGGSDPDECVNAVEVSLDNGVNLIDTSPFYGFGLAEEIVGRALKGKRPLAFIATKCGLLKDGYSYAGNLTAKSINREIEESLKRLNTDYIDLYQTHWPDRKTPLEETYEALNKLKKQGKIRHIGVCNADEELLEEIMKISPIVSVQGEFSMLECNKNAKIIKFCENNNLLFLGYGTYGGGILTGKYNRQPALSGSDARKTFYKYYLNQNYLRSKKILGAAKKVAKENNCSVIDAAADFSCSAAKNNCCLIGARNAAQAVQNAGVKLGHITQKQINRFYEFN